MLSKTKFEDEEGCEKAEESYFLFMHCLFVTVLYVMAMLLR